MIFWTLNLTKILQKISFLALRALALPNRPGQEAKAKFHLRAVLKIEN